MMVAVHGDGKDRCAFDAPLRDFGVGSVYMVTTCPWKMIIVALRWGMVVEGGFGYRGGSRSSDVFWFHCIGFVLALVLGKVIGTHNTEVLRSGLRWGLLEATTMKTQVSLEVRQSGECPSFMIRNLCFVLLVGFFGGLTLWCF